MRTEVKNGGQSERYMPIIFDEDEKQRAEYLARNKIPWEFHNLLPYTINVYVFRAEKLDLIGTIGAQGAIKASKSRSGMELKAGDEIHVLLSTNTADPASSRARQYEITRPVWLRGDSRMVKIGDIVYEIGASFTNAIDIHHDMIGLRIHNHLSMPVDVYWKGLKIASISGDDGTGYMAGSPNSAYLNNERFGFQIDDKLSFVFKHDQRAYATVTLIDNYTSDIIIGETTQKFNGEIQDMFGYRIDSPNINGLIYFDQVTGYTSTGRAAGRYGPKGTTSRSDGAATLPKYSTVLAAGLGVKL